MKHLARQVLDLLERGEYVAANGVIISIASLQEKAVADSILYSPDELEELRSKISTTDLPNIHVTDQTTQQAAYDSAHEGTVTLLNFASARNPGGGFLNGAKAQEEDICRCSGLYPTLVQHDTYYQTNRKQKSLLYTDHLIYSPEVPFFKTRGTGEFLDEPFTASVITAPAPNSGPFLKTNPGEEKAVFDTFLRRWQNVLTTANQHQSDSLILGAWGCGAFGGDPNVAAETALSAIKSHSGELMKIIFAIPGKTKQSKANLEAFRDRLYPVH